MPLSDASVGAWALLEPIEGGSNELEEECGGGQERRTSSRARTPMFATSISWDEVVVQDRWTVETHKQQATSFVHAFES